VEVEVSTLTPKAEARKSRFLRRRQNVSASDYAVLEAIRSESAQRM
jgi:hypothetical protein